MDKIKVQISCSQVVHYNQTVELTKDEWEDLMKTDENEMSQIIGDYIDLKDPSFCDDFDDIELTATINGKNYQWEY